MIWFEDKQISAEILLMRGLSPDNWNTPLPITIGKKTKPLTLSTMGASGGESRNPGGSPPTENRGHDVYRRYHSADRIVRPAVFFPLGYLTRHYQRRIRTTLRLMFFKPRYVKPAGVLRRDNATGQGKLKKMTKAKTTATPLPLWQYWRGLSGWNFYFLVKFALLWAGYLNFHPMLNPVFLAFLLVPIPEKKTAPGTPLDSDSARLLPCSGMIHGYRVRKAS